LIPEIHKRAFFGFQGYEITIRIHFPASVNNTLWHVNNILITYAMAFTVLNPLITEYEIHINMPSSVQIQQKTRSIHVSIL